MLRAVTAPVLLAVPTARAHCPTARADGDADPVEVKVVLAASVTTTLEVALVRGFVSATVTAEPLTAVTIPDAAPNWPLPNRPPAGGRAPKPPDEPRPPERAGPTGAEPTSCGRSTPGPATEAATEPPVHEPETA